jgi:hypothetical protein
MGGWLDQYYSGSRRRAMVHRERCDRPYHYDGSSKLFCSGWLVALGRSRSTPFSRPRNLWRSPPALCGLRKQPVAIKLAITTGSQVSECGDLLASATGIAPARMAGFGLRNRHRTGLAESHRPVLWSSILFRPQAAARLGSLP